MSPEYNELGHDYYEPEFRQVSENYMWLAKVGDRDALAEYIDQRKRSSSAMIHVSNPLSFHS
jgi:hypothetical protein